MGFEDISKKMREKRQAQNAQANEEKPFDFDESYRIRAKMLGVLLYDARNAAARTLEDCARLLHVEPAQVQAWEFGDEVPSLPQLELLTYYLDVPISHFWSLETLKISRGGRQDMQPEYITLRNRMIGAMLRHAREAEGITIEQLAETSGLDIEKVQQYELGDVPPPMHELAVLASGVKKNLDYFLESTSHIGELLALREAWKHFSELPEDVREFAANPVNIGFIHIAVMLSKMPTDRLRQVGASIVDITM